MTFLWILAVFLGLVGGATIHQTLKDGVCVCVADSDIYARDGPGEEHRVVAVLRTNDCYVTNGGILHIYGSTWYEVRGVNQQNAWINGYHLRAVNMTVCTGVTAGVSSTPFTISGTDPFSGGNPFQTGLGTCTEGGIIYKDGQSVQHQTQTCTCTRGAIVCPSLVG